MTNKLSEKLNEQLDLTNVVLKKLYYVSEESVKTVKLLKSKAEVLNYFMTHEPESVEFIIYYTNEIDKLLKEHEQNLKLIDALNNVLISI
jgi:hypothetical protein